MFIIHKNPIRKDNIFVYDFDDTLTVINSHSNFSIPLFTEKQIKNISEMFDIIKQNPENYIYILSRGLKNGITEYLHKNLPNIFCQITYIYGAHDREDCGDFDTPSWALWKKNKLCRIQETYKNHGVIFFDDAEENIKLARELFYTIQVTTNNKDETDVYTKFIELYNKITNMKDNELFIEQKIELEQNCYVNKQLSIEYNKNCWHEHVNKKNICSKCNLFLGSGYIDNLYIKQKYLKYKNKYLQLKK